MLAYFEFLANRFAACARSGWVPAGLETILAGIPFRKSFVSLQVRGAIFGAGVGSKSTRGQKMDSRFSAIEFCVCAVPLLDGLACRHLGGLGPTDRLER